MSKLTTLYVAIAIIIVTLLAFSAVCDWFLHSSRDACAAAQPDCAEACDRWAKMSVLSRGAAFLLLLPLLVFLTTRKARAADERGDADGQEPGEGSGDGDLRTKFREAKRKLKYGARAIAERASRRAGAVEKRFRKLWSGDDDLGTMRADDSQQE